MNLENTFPNEMEQVVLLNNIPKIVRVNIHNTWIYVMKFMLKQDSHTQRPMPAHRQEAQDGENPQVSKFSITFIRVGT